MSGYNSTGDEARARANAAEASGRIRAAQRRPSATVDMSAALRRHMADMADRYDNPVHDTERAESRLAATEPGPIDDDDLRHP